MADVVATAKKIIGNVERVIVGKRRQVILSLVAWFCEGHILLEDVPGVAKTLLARALAKSVGCHFKRIQCTPDLLPTDVTARSSIPRPRSLSSGPVRSSPSSCCRMRSTGTPRTQAALLEAGRGTSDCRRHHAPAPAAVPGDRYAEPDDHEGTFATGSPARPLPGPFQPGYPSVEEERMLELLEHRHPLETLEPVVTADDLLAVQQAARRTWTPERRLHYVDRAEHAICDDVSLGGSPRRRSPCSARRRPWPPFPRNFVKPDARRWRPRWMHRLILRPESRLRTGHTAVVATRG